MKNLIVLFLFSLSLFLVSCEKENTSPTSPSDLFNLTPVPEDADAFIGITQSGVAGLPFPFYVEGRFKDAEGNNVALETFKIGSVEIQPNQPNNQYYLLADSILTDEIRNKMGDTLEFQLQGAGYNLSLPAPMPELIALTSIEPTTPSESEVATDAISQEQGFTVKWASHDNEYPVAFLLIYDAPASNRYRGLPFENISLGKYPEDAAGELFISPQDLAKFPIGGFIKLFIARARQVITQHDGKNVVVNAVSFQSYEYELTE